MLSRPKGVIRAKRKAPARDDHRFWSTVSSSWLRVARSDWASGFGRVVAAADIPPSPLIYWNLQVSAKIKFDLLAAITCGQNLEPQRLRSVGQIVKELV